MKWRTIIYFWWFDVKSLLGKTKRRIWNKHILLWWHRLYIRKNEFHCSLNMDVLAILEMDEQETKKYFADLARRRKIAHQRDLAKY